MIRKAVRAVSEIRIPVAGRSLFGALCIPPDARGLILLVHGSGRGQRAAVDRHAAQDLQAAGFGTIVMDLLEENEAGDIHNVFDSELQASRLIEVVQDLRANPATRSLQIGYLGAGTGSGTALLAAAKDPERVAAIVSRGGRCDVASFWLPRITVPTMLIVGDQDASALRCNKDAYLMIEAHEKELVVIPGATHLFEESAMLQKASSCTSRWFARHLGAPRSKR